MDKLTYIQQSIASLFRTRLSRLAAFAIPVLISAGVLDYFAAAQKFKLFLACRILTALFLLAVSYAAAKLKPGNIHPVLAFSAVLFAAIAAEITILESGGHKSPYYIFMLLLGLYVIAAFPKLLFQTLSAVAVYSIYLLPILYLEEISDATAFLASNFFLLCAFSSGLYLSASHHKRIVNEFGLQYELEKNSTALTDAVNRMVEEQTSALSIRNRDLLAELSVHKKSEQQLQASQQQLRTLFVRIQEAREEERTRIARQLHDELGQILTALKMDVASLRSAYTDHKVFAERSRSMMDLIDATIRTVRKVLSELRPDILDHLGLSAAIEWQAKEFEQRTGICCDLAVNTDGLLLDSESSTVLFRVFQETLAGAALRNGATRIKISLMERKGNIELCIRDNGRENTSEDMAGTESLELVGIQERVRALDGTVRIKPVKNRGTTISVTIPLTRSLLRA